MRLLELEKNRRKSSDFYVKINGRIFEVDGNKDDPETWTITCEHLEFERLCQDCENFLLEWIVKDNYNMAKVEIIER